jgi:molybdopterin-guanine dinucleotide biosynthesis protein A
MQHISAVIIAGGKNSRIGGENKSWLSIDNQTIFERQLAILKPIFNTIFVVTNHPETYSEIKSTKDIYQNAGPLAGIHAALRVAETPTVFVFSCDMPFLSSALINQMLEQFFTNPCEILVPMHDNKMEPLHAIYHKSTLPKIETMLNNEIYRIRALFPISDMRYFNVSLNIDYEDAFFNINNPLDLQNAESHATRIKQR